MTEHPNRRREDRFPARVWRFFYRTFFIFGVAAAFSVFLMLSAASKMLNFAPPKLPEKILLTHAFKPGLGDTPGRPSLSQPLLRPGATVRDVVDALDRAGKDPRVTGFAATIEGVDYSIAHIQELRAAITRFRAGGKFAYVFSGSFGGLGPGMGDYLLASAFDTIWLQPVGMAAVAKPSAEMPYLKGFFDKIGVEAQFAQQGVYKGGAETFTENAMPPAQRAALASLVGDLTSQIVDDVASARGLSSAEVEAIIARGPYADAEAKKLKLVDRIGYQDEMEAEAREKTAGADTKPVDLLGYSFIDGTHDIGRGVEGFVAKFKNKEKPDSLLRGAPKIALIFGSGEIVPYAGERGLFGEAGIAADKLAKSLEKAREDKDVVAVILRIDSPGGSPEGSETVRRALALTQKAGKPVVVSMGGYAASGGYWIASAADKIVAQPGTITGSIGVFGGKFVVQKLMEKLGVSWEAVPGEGNMWSPNRPFTADEFARFDALQKNIYDAFTARVAQGRKMTKEQVEAAAQGRALTGRQALAAGLVDRLGGLEAAVAEARILAKVSTEKEIPVVRFPPERSTLERFISMAAGGAFAMPVIETLLPTDVMRMLRGETALRDGFLMAPEAVSKIR